MLAGTLNDVPLPDVLALLAQANKTGSVHVIGDGRRGRIDLIGGQIGMAQANVGRLGLVRRLVGSGALRAEELAPGLEAAAASPDPDIQLVRSSFSSGAIAAEVVREAAEAHIVDAMFDLLRVEAGRFRFDPCKVADLGVQRPPQDVLADVDDRNRQWEEIRVSVPAPGAVVRMIPRIGHDEVVLQSSTWRLLSLVDGRRTVAELVNVLGHGEFEVSQSLHRLVGEGLVAVVVNVGGSGPEEAADVDHVMKLELELAERRSDASSQLSGRLEWDAGTPLPSSKRAEANSASTNGARTADGDGTSDAVDLVDSSDRTGDGEPRSTGHQDVDDWADVKLPEASEGGADVEEPEVYTTQLGDPDANADADADADAEDAPARSNRTTANGRRESLAATTERRGRLLPEPEPGHDAADLTRRLLEGVGKS